MSIERVFIKIDKQLLLDSIIAVQARIDPLNHEAIDELYKVLILINSSPSTEDKSVLPRTRGMRR